MTGAQPRPGRPATLTTTIDPIRVLRRHMLAIVVAAVLGGTIGIAAFVLLATFFPQYRGDYLFEVTPGVQRAGDIGGLDLTTDDMVYRIAQTESYMLTSRPTLDRALKNAAIRDTRWHRRFIKGGVFAVDDALDDLVKHVSTTVFRNSNLFSVNWTTSVPSDVPIVLNAIGEAYMNERSERDAQIYQKNLPVFEGRLRETQTKLDDLAAEMMKLIRSANLTSLDDTRYSAQAYKMQQLIEQHANASQVLNLTRTSQDLISQKIMGKIEPSADDILEAERDPSLSEQISGIQNLKAEVRRLYESGRRGDDPIVVQWETRLRAMEMERDVKIQQVIRRNLEAQARTFADNYERYRGSVEQLEDEIEKMNVLLKDLTAQQAQYQALKTRREYLEARRSADMALVNEVQLMRLRADAARVRKAQQALTPRTRSFPKAQVIVPLGVLLLSGLTVGVIFLRELTDQRVKSASDLGVLPGAYVLGSLPDLEDEPTGAKAAELVLRRHPSSVLAESYRQAFASLLPMLETGGHQTLVLVGGLPGSGTTTCATNLAAAAAAMGKRVLVIDANFRRPRLPQAMGVADDGRGFGDVLCGAAAIDDTFIDAGEGITVMSAGTPANRIFDRLNNGVFDRLIPELRSRFDLVIFDAPPAVVAGDALMLANKVDASILVVRAHQEHRGLVARLIHRLSDTRAELLGVLLNRPRGIAGGYLKKNYATMAGYTAGTD